MSVSVLEEETFADPPELVRLYAEAAQKPEPPRPAPKPPKPPKEMSEMVQALASVLTVRVCIALNILGAFALAMCVVQRPTIEGIVALGIFTAVILPLCWLAQKRVA